METIAAAPAADAPEIDTESQDDVAAPVAVDPNTPPPGLDRPVKCAGECGEWMERHQTVPTEMPDGSQASMCVPCSHKAAKEANDGGSGPGAGFYDWIHGKFAEFHNRISALEKPAS